MICARPDCGNEFEARPHGERTKRFCSTYCRFRWNHQENPVGVERHRAACLNYWHKADGGYIQRRRRHLGQQRQEILKLLKEDDG